MYNLTMLVSDQNKCSSFFLCPELAHTSMIHHKPSRQLQNMKLSAIFTVIAAIRIENLKQRLVINSDMVKSLPGTWCSAGSTIR